MRDLGNSPLNYFRGLISLGNCVSGVLERKVAICYSIQREASVFVARAGINKLGINMKFHTEASTQAKMPAATIHNTGVALKQFGLVLAKFADDTYFCGKDLSGVVAANQPSFQLSSRIVDGLTVEAMSHDLTGEQGQQGLAHLGELVSDYVQNPPLCEGSVTAAKRGKRR